MSDGVELKSVCCQDNFMVNREGEQFKIKLQHNDLIYDSRLPVYTCRKCNSKWALEKVIKHKVR